MSFYTCVPPGKSLGPRLLKALLADIGWSEDDLVRLKLIRNPSPNASDNANTCAPPNITAKPNATAENHQGARPGAKRALPFTEPLQGLRGRVVVDAEARGDRRDGDATVPHQGRLRGDPRVDRRRRRISQLDVDGERSQGSQPLRVRRGRSALWTERTTTRVERPGGAADRDGRRLAPTVALRGRPMGVKVGS